MKLSPNSIPSLGRPCRLFLSFLNTAHDPLVMTTALPKTQGHSPCSPFSQSMPLLKNVDYPAGMYFVVSPHQEALSIINSGEIDKYTLEGVDNYDVRLYRVMKEIGEKQEQLPTVYCDCFQWDVVFCINGHRSRVTKHQALLINICEANNQGKVVREILDGTVPNEWVSLYVKYAKQGK